MSKRKINTDKSWWVKSPDRELELLELAGLTGGHKYDFLGHYGQAMKVYYNKKQNSAYIQKSVITKTMKISPRRSTTINKVLSNRWLFYSMQLPTISDVLLQPIFDMTNMTETKFNNMLKAVYEQNMKKLLKLCPNILPTPEQYSKGLFSEEEMSDKTDLENAAENECHETVARQSLDGQETVTRPSRDAKIDQSLIIGTHNANKRESKSEKENKSYNPDWMVDKDSIEREIEPCQPASLDETTGRTDESFLTAESSWENYLEKLTPESKELQSLLEFAGDDREFILKNIDRFKKQLLNKLELRGKKDNPKLRNNYFKNEYLYCLLRSPTERAKIVKDIKDSLDFTVQTEFLYHKEGYKYDLFNKDGDRMSGGKIIPRDAPPQPSPEHWWSPSANKWCR